MKRTKLSRSTLWNPTQTRTLANTYERQLLRLVRTFGKAAVSALDQALEPARALETSPERHLEPASFRIAWFVQQLKVLAENEIISPGTKITRQATLAAFRHGTKYGEMALVQVGISSKLGEGPADAQVIDVLQARNLMALEGISAETNKQIIRSLTDGLNAGEGVVKLRERLMKEVKDIGFNRARLMAHTETMHACNEGAKVRYRQVGISQVEWLTAKGERVCPQCAALDGTVYDIDLAPPCPLHPVCRCTLLPVAGGSR